MTTELANFSIKLNQIEDEHEKSFAELKESLEAIREVIKGRNMKIQRDQVKSSLSQT